MAVSELIYLDLNHWVGLAKARLGQPDAGAYAEALAELRTSVSAGRVVVPLSSVHYMEISRIASAQRRADLALTMGQISNYVTLTPRETFLRYEFRRSLAKELGTTYSALPPPITGHGFAHAFGRYARAELRGGEVADRERFAAARIRDFIPKLEENTGFGWRFIGSGRSETPLELMNEAVNSSAQFRMLMGPRDKQDSELLELGFKPSAAYDVVTAITRREQDLAAQLAADPKWLRSLDDIIDARALYWDLNEDWDSAVSDIWPRVVGMSELGKDRLTRILRGIPIVDVESSVRRAHFRNPSHKWRPSDIHDSDFAGTAVVYCDVVLTERHLRAQLHAERLDSKYRTIVMSGPKELVAHLSQSPHELQLRVRSRR